MTNKPKTNEERMEKEEKKIAIWDEDRGWVYHCNKCNHSTTKESEVCGYCGGDLLKTERV
jgi:rRNA maturation endonuclease Nob1